ncbi:MAG TPA: chromosomal replication initiator protein DnaA [Methylocystis sp.]|nr:chromosomal replication initiator protein DnaA [Methylocystis sp.]
MSEKHDDLPAEGPNDELERWERVRQKLRSELGDAIFDSWFAGLEFDRVENGLLHLTVPTKFLKSWVQSRYQERIQARTASEFPNVERVVIELRTPNRKPPRDGATSVAQAASRPRLAEASAPAEPAIAVAASKRAAKTAVRPDNDQMSGSPLDRRLSFATFLVGPSNQLAHAAARRVVEPRQCDNAPLFNPFYTHAAVGLGKTHLLQAMAHEAANYKRRVVYLTAEKFTSSFVSAISAQTSILFKETLRGIDMLIVDDVQFLRGEWIQQEFCHILNALIDAGRQIVVAADRPPSELETLDERVLSRLKSGLCVDIGPLDEGLRFKIVEARISAARQKQPTFAVSPEVVTYVAKTITTNGRDLEGAVNRLLAHSTLNGAPLSIATAEAAIRDLVQTQEPKRVKIEDIQRLVASHYSVSRNDILSARRTANVVRPRQIAMYLSKVLTPRSLPEIGRRFGGRDHTTVLHAVRKIEALVAKDRQVAEVIELLKRVLSEQ